MSAPARVLFVNLTRGCNIDCPRCYLTPVHRAGREALDGEVLAAVLRDPFFSRHDGPVLVIHQGGEPQLMGRERFKALVDVVRTTLPCARQTAVSNMVGAPDWFLDLAGEAFGGRIETTWAAGRKQTLAGDGARYQAAFVRALRKAVEHGVNCPINVELNDDTVAAGPDVLLDLMQETGARDCEFDLSFDFAAFRSAPVYGPGGTPILPPTVPYAQVRAYLLDLRRKRFVRGLSQTVRTHSLMPLAERGHDMPFNTQSEDRFVTLNPDGTVTTIPLYSDLVPTYLGNARTDRLSDILSHPNRMVRIMEERRRVAGCAGCVHWLHCQGGPSHAPWTDGSGECAGIKGVLDRL